MKVQAVVAWAVSELASHYPKSQDLFANNNVIRLLVLEDDEMKKITNPLGNGNKKATNFQNLIETTMTMIAQTKNSMNGVNVNHQHQHSLSAGGLGFSNKGREFEDPATKAYEAAARSGHPAKSNHQTLPHPPSIWIGSALQLCFAVPHWGTQAAFSRRSSHLAVSEEGGLTADARSTYEKAEPSAAGHFAAW
nr:uncharacterized protein LOC109167727 [Ipomoea batatas]